MKPNNFPERKFLNGTEELYTQTNDVSEKYTLESAKVYINAIEVTYDELKNLIGDSKLVAGSHYIITDYQTCYDQPDYDIDNNPIYDPSIYKFSLNIDPIIVMAISEKTFATDAYQPKYPNDKIKYDVNFSSTEITGSKAFGRITERIDEFGNRTDYDHRNIFFKRYVSYSYLDKPLQSGTIELNSSGQISGTTTSFTSLNVGDVIAIPSTNEIFFEITNIVSDFTMYVTGATVPNTGAGKEFYVASNDDFVSHKRTNIISQSYKEYITFSCLNYVKNYIGDTAIFYSSGNFNYLLSNNVFQGENFIDNNFGDITINNSISANYCTGNNLGAAVFDNIIIGDFNSNMSGQSFNGNYIKTTFYVNTIDSFFSSNYIFGDSFQNNNIGISFMNNTIIGNFYSNNINFYFKGNSISGDCFDNSIENNFTSNIIDNNFIGNNIGNYFLGNDIGENFRGNTIQNNFESNIIKNNFGYESGGGIVYGNQIANNFKDNTIGVGFYNNDINGSFTGNTIGGSFNSNEINNSFLDNDMGQKFQKNNINGVMESCSMKDNFQLNRIECPFLAYYNFVSATHVISVYNCRIFLSNDGNIYLEYFAITTPTYVSPTA